MELHDVEAAAGEPPEAGELPAEPRAAPRERGEVGCPARLEAVVEAREYPGEKPLAEQSRGVARRSVEEAGKVRQVPHHGVEPLARSERLVEGALLEPGAAHAVQRRVQ